MPKPVPGRVVQGIRPSPPRYPSPRPTNHTPERSSHGRGFRLRGSIDDQWGRSESLDPDNVGDIADEGIAHRG